MVNEQGITIERIFNAPVEKVWEAWTSPEIVKQWWGPEHFTAPSIKIDLRVGGKYIYCMRGPAGTEFDKDMYSAGIFKEIVPPSVNSGQAKLVVTDYFSDENGNKVSPKAAGLEAPEFPDEQTVTITFEDGGEGKTKLSIHYPKPENEAQFEAMKHSGMEEGWGTSLNKLEKVAEG